MPNAAPLLLTPEISALIRDAFSSGHVLLLAVVDPSGKPILSFRGSTAVYSDTQLCFWARKSAGGTLEAIERNPQVALMYRSPAVPLLQFSGRARITDDPKERERIFGLSDEKERERDPKQEGRAIVIDLDEVKGVLGFNKDGPIFTHLVRGQS